MSKEEFRGEDKELSKRDLVSRMNVSSSNLSNHQLGEEERVSCPKCAEKILTSAKICRFCGSKVEKQQTWLSCCKVILQPGFILVGLIGAISFVFWNEGLVPNKKTISSEVSVNEISKLEPDKNPVAGNYYRSRLGGSVSFINDSDVEILPEYSVYQGEKLGLMTGTYKIGKIAKEKAGGSSGTIKVYIHFHGLDRVVQFNFFKLKNMHVVTCSEDPFPFMCNYAGSAE